MLLPSCGVMWAYCQEYRQVDAAEPVGLPAQCRPGHVQVNLIEARTIEMYIGVSAAYPNFDTLPFSALSSHRM